MKWLIISEEQKRTGWSNILQPVFFVLPALCADPDKIFPIGKKSEQDHDHQIQNRTDQHIGAFSLDNSMFHPDAGLFLNGHIHLNGKEPLHHFRKGSFLSIHLIRFFSIATKKGGECCWLMNWYCMTSNWTCGS